MLFILINLALSYAFDNTNVNLEGSDPYIQMPNFKVGL